VITITTKLSSKNQLTLPKEARRALGLKPGNSVIVVVMDSEVRLYAKPKSVTDYMRGLGKEVWAALGGGDAYLKQERDSWDSTPSSKN